MHNRAYRVLGALAVIGASLAAAAGPAGATGANLMSYKKAYPESKGVSCKICHVDSIGTAKNLGPLGLALQQFKGKGKATALTAEEYKAFDAADLDGDGVTNRAELDAKTDPLDPASK